MYRLSSKILHRIKLKLNQINESYGGYLSLLGSREKAKRYWVKIQVQNDRTVVDRRLLKKIKAYCRNVFGSASYWPWLAVYTELRGEFKEGWMPDEYYRFKFLSRMNPKKFMAFSEAKTIDYKLFNDSIIEPLFFRSNGQYCSKNGAVISKNEVYQVLDGLDEEVVIKPDMGHGGQGIEFNHAHDICLEAFPPETDILFQTVLKQHPTLNRLYSHSINTFRVLTFIDSEGIVNVKFIILRFGQGGNRVDNGVSGGGWVLVHVNGAVEPVAYDSQGIALGTHHPDTGIEYGKLEIPYLQKVVTLCKQMHRTFPYLRIIGWDVFVNEEGDAKLIEWNANYPGFWTIEAHFGPFFEDVIYGQVN